MKSFSLERLNSEIFEKKSKHNNFGKTEYIEYGNILLNNFKFAFGTISEEKKVSGYSDIDKLLILQEMATSFDESDLEEIDSFNDNNFYKFNYIAGKPVKFAKIIAIDNDICYKIREKRFNLNRTIRMEIKNEPKWKTYI